jgi:glycerol-3-phosphate cytidylyltransferase
MKKGVIFGVFDLLHVGHVRVLEEAKKHCDHLTVCVFSDSVAQSYKRRTPVIRESERLEMVESLKCVDVAYLINFRSPIDMPEMDVYFVSEKLRGKRLYLVPKDRLGDVTYLPYSEGTSTTAVIRRCQLLKQ